MILNPSNIRHSTPFHEEMKYLDFRQKYSRRILNSLLSVSFGDETLRLMPDILRQDKKKVKVLFGNNNRNLQSMECNVHESTFAYGQVILFYHSFLKVTG